MKKFVLLSGLLLCVIAAVLINMGFRDNAQDQQPMTLKEYNAKTGNKDKTVLVYFHASWCMVCAKVKPVIDGIETSYASKLEVLKVDTDKDKEVAEEFEIDALPVLMLYKKGTRQWIHVGIIDEKSLRAKIDASLE